MGSRRSVGRRLDGVPGAPVILIPAAGASARMAPQDKLLLPVDDEPMLAHTARAALATGLPVVVTLAPSQQARRAALAGLDVALVEVPDAATGMAASFRAYTRAHSATDLVVLPADMPELKAGDISAVVEAFLKDGRSRPHRGADAQGRAGHPVILPTRLAARLETLTGDQGARSLLRGEEVISVPLPDAHATTDIDTVEDWQNWLGTRARPASSGGQ